MINKLFKFKLNYLIQEIIIISPSFFHFLIKYPKYFKVIQPPINVLVLDSLNSLFRFQFLFLINLFFQLIIIPFIKDLTKLIKALQNLFYLSNSWLFFIVIEQVRFLLYHCFFLIFISQFNFFQCFFLIFNSFF